MADKLYGSTRVQVQRQGIVSGQYERNENGKEWQEFLYRKFKAHFD